VSSSTLATVFMGARRHSQFPRVSGRMESMKLRRGSVGMHRVSMRWAEVENLLSSRLDEGVQGVCRRCF
jgi:hypothetical protein